MGSGAVRDNINTSGWPVFSDEKRRVLDVFYTEYDTKLFVEDGALIEETTKSSRSEIEIHSSDKYYGWSCTTPPESPCTTPPQSLQMTLEEVAAAGRLQTIDTAKAALEYYNAKHHTKYELVDPVLSKGCLWGGDIWFHSNFTAKLEISPKSCQEDRIDLSPKLFFAEMTIRENSGGKRFSVTACRALDGKSTTRCEMCSGKILHPTRRFRQGLYQLKQRALRPRWNGRVLKK